MNFYWTPGVKGFSLNQSLLFKFNKQKVEKDRQTICHRILKECSALTILNFFELPKFGDTLFNQMRC